MKNKATVTSRQKHWLTAHAHTHGGWGGDGGGGGHGSKPSTSVHEQPLCSWNLCCADVWDEVPCSWVTRSPTEDL